MKLIWVGIRVRARQRVEAADLVSPKLLGAGDRKLGGQHQSGTLGGMGAELRAAGAEREFSVKAINRFPQSFGNRLSAGQITVGQQHGKLFAAVAGRNRNLGQQHLQCEGRILQRLISSGVSVLLIVCRKMV